MVTNAVMKDYAQNLDKFFAMNKLRTRSLYAIGYAPDKVTGLLLSLLGHRVTYLPWSKEANSVFPGVGERGRGNRAYGKGKKPSKETILLHYVSPREMLAAHQRAEHEKLDRMVNSGDYEQIITVFREHIDRHFTILRAKQVQVKYLATKASKCNEQGSKENIYVRKHDSNQVEFFSKYDDIPPSLESEERYIAEAASRGFVV